MKHNEYFQSLDVIRAFAALSVLIYHVIEHTHWQNLPQNWLFDWFRIGWIGVDLFFAVSGFVITYSALNLFARDHSSFTRNYIAKRLRRIVPLHYLTCLVFILVCFMFHIEIAHFFSQVVAHLLFVHNLFQETHGGINGPNWSVGVEMQFYFLMLFLIPWLYGLNRRIWTLLPAMILISWAWRYGAFLSESGRESSTVYPLFIKATQLPGTLDGFAFGIAMAVYISSRGAAFFRKYRSVCLIFTVAICAMMFRIYWMNAVYWDDIRMVVFFRTLLSLCCTSVVLCFIAFDNFLMGRSLVAIRYLGRISYGLYLWHLPVIMVLQQIPNLEGWRFLALVLALTISLSAVSWRFFEKEFLLPAGAPFWLRLGIWR